MADKEFYEDDNALWKAVASDFAPLKSKKPIRIARDAAAAASQKRKAPEIKITPIIPSPPVLKKEIKQDYLEAGDMKHVDGSVAQKLKDGDYPIEARLDLHGRTQDEAFETMRYFIATAHSMGKRCILVITGKGVEGNGILREQFPKWLSTSGLREYILAFTHAKPQHGGDGAFYVLLRKNR